MLLQRMQVTIKSFFWGKNKVYSEEQVAEFEDKVRAQSESWSVLSEKFTVNALLFLFCTATRSSQYVLGIFCAG
jgi:hypothetical protein